MNMQHIATNRVAWGILILLLMTVFVFAQDVATINGKVIDGKTGEALPNTNVSLVGTKLGAATDNSGNFSIKAPADEYQIQVSYIGYKSVKQVINAQANKTLELNFSLKEDFFQTEQVVVTATRTEKLLQDVPVVTEFISQEEIVEKGAEDLSEILEDRPGIIVQTGVSGGMFYMNGVDNKRILFLVDGVPVAGKVNNRIPMNLIDSDNIEHIELVKGPGSSLYGSDAMGGVVNIITKGYSNSRNIKFNGRAGSNDLYSGNFSLSNGNAKYGYVLNFDHMREGFDQPSSEYQVLKNHSSNVNGKFGINLALLGHVDLSGAFKTDLQNSTSDASGSQTEDEAKIRNYNLSTNWKKQFSEKLDFDLVGYYNNNRRTYESGIIDVETTGTIDTTKETLAGFRSDLSFVPAQAVKWTVGVDASTNDYTNDRLSSSKTRNSTGVHSQVELFYKNLTTILGGRYDKVTEFDASFSPRISGLYSVTNDFKLRASYGEGFRVPSFIETYSDFLVNFAIPVGTTSDGRPNFVPFTYNILGNPDLKPEKSKGANFGFEYFFGTKMLLNVGVFQTKFDNMIIDYQKDYQVEIGPPTFVPTAFFITQSYLNVDKATSRGVELQSKLYLMDNFNVTLGYNYTDIEYSEISDPALKEAIDQSDQKESYSQIPAHTGSVRLHYSIIKNKLRFSLREQFFSSRDILEASEAGNRIIEKDPYHMIDFTTTFAFNNLLSLMAGITNLADHTDINYGPYVGRRYFFGIQTGI